MNNAHLEEYRCGCGKLLFKGLILISLVEIKCKRCSRIISFGELIKKTSTVSFLISVDNHGIIQDLCKGAEIALKCSREDLIGRSIGEFSPVIRDQLPTVNNKKPRSRKKLYEIQNSVFAVKDAPLVQAESYCINFKNNKKGSGYYIFSKLAGSVA